MSGFAADVRRRVAAGRVAIVFGDTVIAWQRPWFDVSNDRTLQGPTARSGFHFEYEIPKDALPGQRLRVFALFNDGSALEIDLMMVPL